ncbi:zinc knuckle CX2CX4HX4C containing protein [Tanacetum coccineum]
MENREDLNKRGAFNVSIDYEHNDELDARMKRMKDGATATKQIKQLVRVLGNPNSESMHNSKSNGVSVSYRESVSQPTMNPSRIDTGSNMGGDTHGRGSSYPNTNPTASEYPSIVRTSNIPGNDSRVFETRANSEYIDHEYSDATKEDQFVSTFSEANPNSSQSVRGSNVQIHNIDDVAKLFGVPLNSLRDIDEFVQDLQYVLLSEFEGVVDDNPTSKASPNDPNAEDNLVGKVSPSDPIVQSVDINTNLKSYAGAAGASAKDQPKVISNFRPLVTGPIFDGVNISIPCKVVEKSPIILKKWSMDTRLLKEELTRIPIWVKLHDVPLQVFEKDGRSSFAWCLIEVNSKVDLLDVVTIGIPSLTGDDFTKETIRVEYEWRPPRCDICKKKKMKGKSKSTNGGQFAGPSDKQNVRYEPKSTTSAPNKGATNVGKASKSTSMLKTTVTSSKNDNIITNSYSALNDEEEEEVKTVYDESANLFLNTKTGGSSSFTPAAA